MAVGSDAFNIFRLSDAMAESGYSVSQCQTPSCIHICVTLRHVAFVDQIIATMREATASILRAPGEKGGQGAAIYGMASSMPTGSVVKMLTNYMDSVYAFPDEEDGEEQEEGAGAGKSKSKSKL